MKNMNIVLPNPFKIKLPANTLGKDYIVSDLHGCYDELMRLLDFVGFNYAFDRLFCSGDLIHRGNQSAECLSLLHKKRRNGEKWFFSTIGNHDSYQHQHLPIFSKYGVDCTPYKNELESMPYIYEVEHSIFGKYWITHGELTSQILFNEKDYDIDDNVIERNYDLDVRLYRNIERNQDYRLTNIDVANAKLIKEDLTYQILEIFHNDDWLPSGELLFNSIWSRDLFNYFIHYHYNSILKQDFSFLDLYKDRANRLKIFCGHSVVPFPMVMGHQIYFDTGACFGYDENSAQIVKGFSLWGSRFMGLSLIDIDMGTAYTCITNDNALLLPEGKSDNIQYKRGDIVMLQNQLYDNIYQHKEHF